MTSSTKLVLVDSGFEHIDCDSPIYAPVARLTTFRLFMTMTKKMKVLVDVPVRCDV